MRVPTLLGLSLAALLLAGCDNAERLPKGDAKATMVSKIHGYVAHAGIIAKQDGTFDWAAYTLSGFRRDIRQEIPDRVEQKGYYRSCQPKRPEKTDYVANVHIGYSSTEAALYAFSSKSMHKPITKWLEIVRRKGKLTQPPTRHSSNVFKRVDVVVTETSKPVYLVLQHGAGNVVWNILKAPNVKISHVTALGYGNIAIANLEANVPIQMMDRTTLAGCRIVPARKPAPHWALVRNARETPSNQKYVKASFQRYFAYAKWYHQTFGRSLSRDQINPLRISHVLIGPAPTTLAERVPFKSLKGAYVRITPQQHTFIGTRDDYTSYYRKLFLQESERFLGAPLSSLEAAS